LVVVALVFALDVEAARGGVGEDDCDVVLGGGRLEEALLGAVVAGAGEAGEVEENWGGLGGRGGAGDEEVEFHLGCGCFGLEVVSIYDAAQLMLSVYSPGEQA
jgi:hypothetical protein